MLEAHHLADNSIVTTPAGLVDAELTWLVSILVSDPNSRSMANDVLRRVLIGVGGV
jgi:hypothetical protein